MPASQKNIANQLYTDYAAARSLLITALQNDLSKPLDESIRIAQKIFDRLLFLAFAQSRGLLNTTNIKPHWKNLRTHFQKIHNSHPDLQSLFAPDPAIDALNLPDDPWTAIFENLLAYDYKNKNKIPLNILGHLFERSIADLERHRAGGGAISKMQMQKSPSRKTTGTFYTPPEFATFLVTETLRDLQKKILAENVSGAGLPHAEQDPHHATKHSNKSEKNKLQLETLLHQLQSLRNLKILDPACGSGAFLLAAYDHLENLYTHITKKLHPLNPTLAKKIQSQIPTYILQENLHGVDLSEDAIEITRLTLYLRAAQPHQPLPNLTQNLIAANSLITDPAIHPRAINWKKTFPRIFPQDSPLKTHDSPLNGFDAIITNPPWERLKLQEREFFAHSAPEIASATSAAKRRALITKLNSTNPALHARYAAAKSAAEKISAHIRSSNNFPLTAVGDLNAYMLFAELARSLIAPTGRIGLLLPSGIATDATTQKFFADLINSQTLLKLYDFENKSAVFPDVHRAFKFSALILAGRKNISQNKHEQNSRAADFVFFAHSLADLADENRHIALTQNQITLLNPNTKTCPIFRTRRDAQITLDIYRRIPILIDRTTTPPKNPWQISFQRLFDQTNDAEFFLDANKIKPARDKTKNNFLPFYEAKMFQAYNHRAAGVIVDRKNFQRQGQKSESSPAQLANPNFTNTPRWWGDRSLIQKQIEKTEKLPPALLAFKNVTSPTNHRTMIATFLPIAGVINSAPLIRFNSKIPPRLQCCLLANLNSFPLDYIARQKIGNINLNFFLIEQFPILPPETYSTQCPWTKNDASTAGESLETFISNRVLKLTCTATNMLPLATACNFNPAAAAPAGGSGGGGIWKWNPLQRDHLRAQLDAAYFLLYGIQNNNDLLHILSTFQNSGVQKNSHHAAPPKNSPANLILHYFTQYAKS